MNTATASQERPIPGRVRPFAKTQGRKPFLKLLAGRDPVPSHAQWRAMADALWDGDAPMDALIDWMFAHGPRESRALFEQALSQGIDSIPGAPAPLRAFFESVDTEPAWLDRNLLDEGARFLHGTGLAAPYVMRDFALMGGYLLSGFNQTLVMTGALAKGSSQRIAETGKWWVDCTEHGGLERFGAGFSSTLHVRLVHGLVRRNLARKAEWDATQWGLPVNQIDMVATYLAFNVVTLGGLRFMGIPITPKESRAVMHLWKYACWLMGVDERWLVDSERDGMVLLYHTFMTQSKPDHTSRELGLALSREPLERRFPVLQGLRRQLAYHQHLSTSRFFLGRQAMRELGLPENVLPWYPLLSAGPRLLAYSGQRLLPATRQRLERRGRQAQLAALASIFGERRQGIINPGENHPAHL